MFQVSSLSELQDSFLPPSSTPMYTIVQMCMRLGSVPDTNFTFDATVTTNNGHLNEHYKVEDFDFIGIFCSAAIISFFITDGYSTCCHSPPWSSWSSWTPLTHWLNITGTQQGTKSWNKLPTCKCAILLMYTYVQASKSHSTSSFPPISTNKLSERKHCQEIIR